MKLCLTTGAAPELGFGAFEEACRGRGLDGAELVVGAEEDPEALVQLARAAGVRVVALRAQVPSLRQADGFARASKLLHVPVSTSFNALEGDLLRGFVDAFARAGGRLLLSHGTELQQALATLELAKSAEARGVVGLAWEIRPFSESLMDGGALYFAVHEALQIIRLYGGGPEQHDQEGRGVGPLLTDLALADCNLPLILCPSSPDQRPRWGSWLSSRKPAGCGTKAGSSTHVELDVRPVEPRDRLETILGAYRSLLPGGTLDLTVDHDPSCMYYMLESTEPAGSFAFELRANGPEVWRAHVTRR